MRSSFEVAGNGRIEGSGVREEEGEGWREERELGAKSEFFFHYSKTLKPLLHSNLTTIKSLIILN